MQAKARTPDLAGPRSARKRTCTGAQVAGAATVTFDTERVPRASRLDYWNRVNTECFSEISIDPRNESLHGALERRALGVLRISRVNSTAAVVNGGRVGHSAGRASALLLHLQEQGTSLNAQLGRSSVLRVGDITFCDTSRPYTVECSKAVQMMVIRLPHDALLSRFGDIDRFVALHVDGTRGGGAMLASFLRDLWRHCSELEGGEPASHDALVSAVLDLMELLPVSGSESECSLSLGALQKKMSAYVEQRLADFDLSVQTLANAFSVSARHVHRVFAVSGTTPSNYIRDCRLAFAASRLRDTKGSDNVTDIALSSGFNDSTTFSRAFRRRYGVAPRAYRRERLG